MNRPEAVLHQQNPQLHASQEVEDVAAYLRVNGERVPNQPLDKIQAHLGFLAHEGYVNDGIATGDEQSLQRQIDSRVIKAENVPESYFDLQARIAREQGHGDVEITSELKSQMVESIQSDQRASIGQWANYLTTDDAAAYPNWFRQYTFNSVSKLADYDKETQQFKRRSTGTTANYPDLNREALAYVYDNLDSHYGNGQTPTDETTAKLVQNANFGKLYAHTIRAVTPASAELRETTQGSWTKYSQTSDPDQARKLAQSLQGHGTGWCTAGESTAAMQLKGGDFYVYNSTDEQGNDVVPRIAVRMENDQVAEVRGINPQQELEPAMADVTAEQLKGLNGGEAYVQKAEDMKRLTTLEKQLTNNPDAALAKADVKFLYELDHSIQGFGYGRDPRIDQVKALRGDRDHAELKVLAVERIREGFTASAAGYRAIMEQVGAEVGILSEAELKAQYELQLQDWQERGVLDYVAERIISHGELHTPVATPNIVLDAHAIKQLARNFGQDQPHETFVYDKLYDQYSAEELSGQTGSNPVRFSLIPSKLTAELGYKPAEQQQTILETTQAQKPGLKLHVPSVLEAMTFWQTLRNDGDKLNDDSTFDKTLIRHFDLKAKRVGVFSRVPYSCVGVDGKPYLDRSSAATRVARWAVG